MNCDQARELLHTHLDGELELAPSLELEKHLDDCPNCAAAHRSNLSLREAVRDPGQYFRASASLERRIRLSLQPAEAPPARHFTWMVRRFAVAAAVILIIAAAWQFARYLSGSRARGLETEIAAGHVRSLLPGHLTDVASTDTHNVKPWFAGRVDFSPRVIDLAAAGFPLAGGRLDYIGGRTVAVLVYHRRQHTINLFAWPATGASQSGFATSAYKGYNLVHWIRDGLEYWAISDLNAAELRQFAQLADAK